MGSTKLGRNDLCSCGSGRKYKACCLGSQGNKPAGQLVLSDRSRADLMEAFSLFGANSIDAAEQLCTQVLQASTRQPDALHLMALILHRRGQFAAALQMLDDAISQTVNESMLSNRGMVLRSMGSFSEAEESYRRALLLNERSPVLHSNLGFVLQEMSRWNEASTAFRRSLQINPQLTLAHVALGVCLLQTGQLDEAETALRRAVEIDPEHLEARTHLANVLLAQDKLEDAVEAYRSLLIDKPDNLAALENLGNTLSDLGRRDEARGVFARACEISPAIEFRIHRDLALPHIFASKQSVLESIGEFEANLDSLMRLDTVIEVPNVRLFSRAIFNLAYAGIDTLPLQRKVVNFYAKLCPDLLFRAPHLEKHRRAERRLRVGFFSAYTHDHAVSHCFAGLVRGVASELGAEVFLISSGTTVTATERDAYTQFGGTVVRVKDDYTAARAVIADLELDVLVYQDIGMDDLSFFLSFARLARVQCVMGGHPVTTGQESIDYYLSSVLSEPPDAQRHYSEQLVLLDPGPFLFEHPVLPAVSKGRADLGLPPGGRLYLCPMMLQKIHPDFDQAVEGILKRDPHGYVVFFAHAKFGWERLLQARFEKSISSDVIDRVIFLPWLHNRSDFISINALADVVLDPFHFGIGSTAIATFAVGAPMVTWPGKFLRGRVGLSFCRLLGLDECVATSHDDFVARAVRLASDRELQATVRTTILANKDRFFDNRQAVESICNFFRAIGAEMA